MYGQCEATARMGYLPAEKSLENMVLWVLQFREANLSLSM